MWSLSTSTSLPSTSAPWGTQSPFISGNSVWPKLDSTNLAPVVFAHHTGACHNANAPRQGLGGVPPARISRLEGCSHRHLICRSQLNARCLSLARGPQRVCHLTHTIKGEAQMAGSPCPACRRLPRWPRACDVARTRRTVPVGEGRYCCTCAGQARFRLSRHQGPRQRGGQGGPPSNCSKQQRPLRPMQHQGKMVRSAAVLCQKRLHDAGIACITRTGMQVA